MTRKILNSLDRKCHLLSVKIDNKIDVTMILGYIRKYRNKCLTLTTTRLQTEL